MESKTIRTSRMGFLALTLLLGFLLSGCTQSPSLSNGEGVARNDPKLEVETPFPDENDVDTSILSLDSNHQSSYSDDVAWVVDMTQELEDKDRSGKHHHAPLLIDKNGKILLDYRNQKWDYDEIPLYASNFYEGVAIVSTAANGGQGYSGNMLIDKDGSTVWSAMSDGFEAGEKAFGSGSVRLVELPYDFEFNSNDSDGYWNRGFYPVEFHISTYDYTGTVYGVINNDGKWVIEPGEKELYRSELSYFDYVIITEHYCLNLLTGELSEHEYDNDSDALYDYIADTSKRVYRDKHDGLYPNWFNSGSGFFDTNSGEKGSSVVSVGEIPV